MPFLPNLLTLCRFPGALGLLWFPTGSAAFWACYLLCGLTDVLDGWLAQRLHVESVSGARLDSAADLCFTLTVLLRLWPVLTASRAVLACCAVTALLRLGAAAVVKLRFGSFGFLHTRANKVTGVLLFLSLPLYWAVRRLPLLAPVCLAALFSAGQELYLAFAASAWEPDKPGR